MPVSTQFSPLLHLLGLPMLLHLDSENLDQETRILHPQWLWCVDDTLTDYVVLLYTNSLMCCCTLTYYEVLLYAHWLMCCTLTYWCVVAHSLTDVLLHSLTDVSLNTDWLKYCTITRWCIVAHSLTYVLLNTIKYCCTLTDWFIVAHSLNDVLLHTQ